MAWIKAEIEDSLHGDVKAKLSKMSRTGHRLTMTDAVRQALERWAYGLSNAITKGAKK